MHAYTKRRREPAHSVRITMIECPVCRMELDEKTAKIRATVGKRTYYFCSEFCLSYFDPLGKIAHRSLLNIFLSKTFFEIMAIGTGIGGILYTLQGIGIRALIMDTASALAAILAFLVGVEKYPLLREFKLVKKAVLWTTLGVLISIVIIVWHFGFYI